MAKRAREFRYEQGTSRKFWRIREDGATHTIWFGRIGAPGAEQSKRFPGPERARASAEKLIAQKVAKGYVENEGTAARKSTAANTRVKPPTSAVQSPRARKQSTALWKAFADRLGHTLTSQLIPNQIFFDKLRRVFELERLPPSYVEYVCHLRGKGEWDIIRSRRGYPRNLNLLCEPKRLIQERDSFDTILDAIEKFSEAGFTLAQALRPLVPFGGDGAGNELCWDPSLARPNGELEICFVELDRYEAKPTEARTNLGSNLFALVQLYRG